MTMFIPGENISHRFYIPLTQGDVSKIFVSYRQDGRVILVKNVYPGQVENEREGTGSSFVVTLSQQESLLFKDDYSFTVQVNIIVRDGTRCTSKEMSGANGMQHIRKVVN